MLYHVRRAPQYGSIIDEKTDIDPAISDSQKNAALKLIQREVPKDSTTRLHSSILSLPESRLTPLLQQEVTRAGSGKPMTGGIDSSRYESFAEVSPDTNIELMKAALRTAYANMTYLSERQTNITLLEEYGKNAWLIGNSHTEDMQKRLQVELEATKAEIETINRNRKTAQEDSKGELLGLEETWKQGISRIIETQLATDELRRQLPQR